MKKSNKALSIVISIIYAAVAVEWIISIVSQYLKIKGGFSPVAEILYFVPAVLMLIIAGLEIYRLVKGKYKVLDSVLFLILPFVMCISAFVLAPGIVDSNGAYHVSIISSVSLMYFVKDLVAIVAGLVALVLAVIKKKTEN